MNKIVICISIILEEVFNLLKYEEIIEYIKNNIKFEKFNIFKKLFFIRLIKELF